MVFLSELLSHSDSVLPTAPHVPAPRPLYLPVHPVQIITSNEIHACFHFYIRKKITHLLPVPKFLFSFPTQDSLLTESPRIPNVPPRPPALRPRNGPHDSHLRRRIQLLARALRCREIEAGRLVHPLLRFW